MKIITTDEFKSLYRNGGRSCAATDLTMIMNNYIYEYPKTRYGRLNDGGVHTVTEIDDIVHKMIKHGSKVVRLV